MRLRSLLACLLAVSAPLSPAATADPPPATYADSCSADSFVLEYHSWRRHEHVDPPYAPDEMWTSFVRVTETDEFTLVCVHVDLGPSAEGAAPPSFGGRLRFRGVRVRPTLPEVTQDVAACTGLTSLAAGQVGDPASPPYLPYSVSVGAGPGRTDICVVANGSGVRVTLPTVEADGVPEIGFDEDPTGARAGTEYWPPVDPRVPSSTCFGGSYPYRSWRTYDRMRTPAATVHFAERLEWDGANPRERSTCVRVETPAGRVGGVLRREEERMPEVVSDPEAVCSLTVFRSTEPVDVDLRRGVDGSRSAVCLTVAGTPLGFGIDTGAQKADTYTWQTDPL